MPVFTGRYADTRRVRASVQAARDWFANPEAVAAQFGELESFELLDPHTIRFQLPEHNYGVTRFRGHYTCRYETPNETTAAWQSVGVGEPITNKGRATFRADGDGAIMDFEGTVGIELDVNRFLAKGLRPVVETFVARDLKAFVDRMVAALEARS